MITSSPVPRAVYYTGSFDGVARNWHFLCGVVLRPSTMHSREPSDDAAGFPDISLSISRIDESPRWTAWRLPTPRDGESREAYYTFVELRIPSMYRGPNRLSALRINF